MDGFSGINPDEEERAAQARNFDIGARPAAPVAPTSAPAPVARPEPPSAIPPLQVRSLPKPNPTLPVAARGPASMAPQPGPIQSPIEARTTKDQAELERLERTGTGVSQFAKRHPIAGGALNVLDKIGTVAGNVYAPIRGITSVIPGTTAHHNALIGEQRGRIGEDLGEQQAQTGIGDVAARALKEREEAAKLKVETGQLGAPKPKEENYGEFAGFTDMDGTPLLREANSGQVVRADNHKPPTGFKAEKPGGLQTREVTRVVNGVPHSVMVNAETGEDVKDEGQTKVPGESSEQKRSAGESAQVEREARQNIRKAEGAFHDTQRTVSQLTQSIDAAKDGNGLLTSFVPTMEVLGINASNGVHRISPAEAQAAGMPGSFVERFNAFFDKATTGKLTPELQQEGKALAGILLDSAYSRYKSTYDDENGIVSGYGGSGFDKRVPLIQREGAAGGGYTGGGAGTGVTVGGFTFPDQKSADAFKKEAGLP